MKVATYRVGGERRVGIVDERRQTVAAFDVPESEALIGVLALIDRPTLPGVLSPMPLREATLEAPIPRPRRNIFCVGKNYHEHAHEFAASGFDSSAASGAVPKHPIIFSKVPDCVIAHRDPVSIDRKVSEAIDYEAELGVIIGKGGRGITAANAFDHVWGYTIINDVTARDLQGLYSQWLIGKSQDTFCPMGPWAVTRDEIDLKDTKIQCWINGELRQSANTRDLIFDVPTIIETISAGVRLMPGDVIATGTPAGVGIGFKPPKYLVPAMSRGSRFPELASSKTNSARRAHERRSARSDPARDRWRGTADRLSARARRQLELLPAAARFARRLPLHPPRSAGRGAILPALRQDHDGVAGRGRGEILRTVAGAPAHLVAHSMGTLVALHVAAAAPDAVLSLTLFGPIGAPGDAARERLRERARLVRQNGMIAVADAVAAAGLSTATKSINPIALAYVRESHLRQDAEGFAQSCEALAAAGGVDLRRLRPPALLVTGEDDPIAPPTAVQALADAIKSAKVRILARCGHWTPLEEPKQCARLASDYIRAFAS